MGFGFDSIWIERSDQDCDPVSNKFGLKILVAFGLDNEIRINLDWDCDPDSNKFGLKILVALGLELRFGSIWIGIGY